MNAPIPWEQSVEKARRGAQKAMEGRFQVALASFEQFEPDCAVRVRQGDGRTLADFCDEIGMSYNTLMSYRQFCLWWLEGDPSLIEEIGVPNHLAWDALKWSKSNFLMASSLREKLAKSEPSNGKVFSTDDVARMKVTNAPLPRRARASMVDYDIAISHMRNTGDRLTRSLFALRQTDLNEAQREQALEAARRAKAPLDFILGLLEHGDDEGIENFLASRQAIVRAPNPE